MRLLHFRLTFMKEQGKVASTHWCLWAQRYTLHCLFIVLAAYRMNSNLIPAQVIIHPNFLTTCITHPSSLKKYIFLSKIRLLLEIILLNPLTKYFWNLFFLFQYFHCHSPNTHKLSANDQSIPSPLSHATLFQIDLC